MTTIIENGATFKSGSMNGGVVSTLSQQWATRPPDERITGKDSQDALANLHAMAVKHHANSRATVLANRDLMVVPVEEDDKALAVMVNRKEQKGVTLLSPTHWSFGQLAQRAGVPAGWAREVGQQGGSAIVADAMNWGMAHRDVEEVGVLATKLDQGIVLGAVTGPGYGRIWNKDIIAALRSTLDPHWTVPGIFGQPVQEITKKNTTLFLSEQDMFIGLADETRRIEIPNRRAGAPGTLARMILLGNSEVGAGKVFIYCCFHDYTCANRNIWGVEDFIEISFRHTSGAPHRWLQTAAPAIRKFMEAGTGKVTALLDAARKAKLPDVDKFLAQRFTKSQVAAIKQAHLTEEDRPIETIWDANVGATAYARDLPHQDTRLDVERKAGEMMKGLV